MILKACWLNVAITLPWKESGLSFKQTWIPSTKGYFVPSLVKIGLVVQEKNLKFLKCIFVVLLPFHLWKRTLSFICKNWNPLYPRMLCAKFNWNSQRGSWEEFCWQCIFTTVYHWKRTLTRLLKDAHCEVCLKMD